MKLLFVSHIHKSQTAAGFLFFPSPVCHSGLCSQSPQWIFIQQVNLFRHFLFNFLIYFTCKRRLMGHWERTKEISKGKSYWWNLVKNLHGGALLLPQLQVCHAPETSGSHPKGLEEGRSQLWDRAAHKHLSYIAQAATSTDTGQSYEAQSRQSDENNVSACEHWAKITPILPDCHQTCNLNHIVFFKHILCSCVRVQ